MQFLTSQVTTLSEHGSESVIDERDTSCYGSCYDWRVEG